MKLTQEQVSQILYEDELWDDKGDIILYKKISEKLSNFNSGKSSVYKTITIREAKTGKKYRATLCDNPWHMQDEHNSKIEWEELIPKKRK